MGSRSDWETHGAGAHDVARTGDSVRDARRFGAPHARRDVRIRRVSGRARHCGDYRRRRRCGAPAGHDGREDAAAGHRRAGAVEGAARHRFAALDRTDAAGRSGRDDGDRRRRQRGVAGRAHRRARRRRRSRRGSPSTLRRCTTPLPPARRSERGARSNHRRHRRRPTRPHVCARREAHGLRRRHARSAGAFAYRAGRRRADRRARTTTWRRSKNSGGAATSSRTSSRTSRSRRSSISSGSAIASRRRATCCASRRTGFSRNASCASAASRPQRSRRSNDAADLAEVAKSVGFPAVLKTVRGGYDGKGQWRVASLEEAEAAVAEAGGAPLIAERFVDFTRELSVVATRNAADDAVAYPPSRERTRPRNPGDEFRAGARFVPKSRSARRRWR